MKTLGKTENAVLSSLIHPTASLKGNIGKYFIRLLNKHFPPGHKFRKIFIKNTSTLSYPCMPNLKAKIDGHNKKILENTPPAKTKLRNC